MRILYWSLVGAAAAGLVIAAMVGSDVGDSGLLLWAAAGAGPFLALSAYLLWRRPEEATARLLVLTAVAAMAYPALLEALVKSGATGRSAWLALATHQVLSAIGVSAATVMVGLFPTGRASTGGEKLFVRVAWTLPVAVLVLLPTTGNVLTSEYSFPDLAGVTNPLFVGGLGWLAPVARTVSQLVAIAFLAGLVLLIRRYRATEPGQRRQIRSVVYAAAAAGALSAVPWALGEMGVGPTLTHGVLANIAAVPMLLFPAAIVIAVLQPKWIDTDAVIRKSAAFGALSLVVLVVYASIATAFGVAAGRRMPVEAAIVITVVVAIAFHPARIRLQRAVDRWVYGDQPTRFDAVAGFEQAIHSIRDQEELAVSLGDTVLRALRLQWAEVEIAPDPPHLSGKTNGKPVLEVPIQHRGESLGWIRCGPSITGRMRRGDTELVATLASQTGLSVYNARLAARVVHAQEEERRRLERNIHDGAQQELVALVANLGLARAKAARGDLDDSTLVELQEEAKSIVRDLRALAQGIHPSVLTDGGLVEAVRDRCGRLPIPVTVNPSPCLATERFDMDVEGGAYFFVAEALANVLKHAAATRAEVTIRHVRRDLHLTVSDDGIGFDTEAVRGNGLGGLTDRLAALSGTVTVETTPGTGTTLKARLPVGIEH